eukprot:scaffold19620_cov55-Attheya_sp.AAC.1
MKRVLGPLAHSRLCCTSKSVPCFGSGRPATTKANTSRGAGHQIAMLRSSRAASGVPVTTGGVGGALLPSHTKDVERGPQAGTRHRRKKTWSRQSTLRVSLFLVCVGIFFGAFLMLRSETSSHRSPLTREKSPKVAVSRELKHDSLPEKSIYRLTVPDSFGAVHDLSQYVGRVGLVELDTDEEIRNFVTQTYPQVKFPIMGLSTLAKNVVYQTLQNQMPEQRVRANFFKYIVDTNGMAVSLHNKKEAPISLSEEIEQLIDA